MQNINLTSYKPIKQFGSLIIYEDIFSGGDFASISKLFKNKNQVAIYSYYVFKIIPLIGDLLYRLSKAFSVYGKRKYIAENKNQKIKILIDTLDSLFNELLSIMFSQVRIMNRREKVAFLLSQQRRAINLKFIILQSLITILIIVIAIIGKLKIVQL